MDVRAAGAADEAGIRRLMKAEGMSTAGLLAPGTHWWVAEDGDEVVGSVGLETGRGAALVRDLVVAPGHRGRRAGERLLRSALWEADERGSLRTYLFNTAGGDYFRRFKFDPAPFQELVERMPAMSEFRARHRLPTESVWRLFNRRAQSSPWQPWPPDEVMSRMAGVNARWAFTGGWAIDFFLGQVRRPHADTDIALPQAEFSQLRSALGWTNVDFIGHHAWIWDAGRRAYVLDVFCEPDEGDTWICRLEPSLRLPYKDVIRHTAEGAPYMRPEIVLLFKPAYAVYWDFRALSPKLDPQARAWLSSALAQIDRRHPLLRLL